MSITEFIQYPLVSHLICSIANSKFSQSHLPFGKCIAKPGIFWSLITNHNTYWVHTYLNCGHYACMSKEC